MHEVEFSASKGEKRFADLESRLDVQRPRVESSAEIFSVPEARLEASENAVVDLKKKHLNSKNEAVKIAMRYENIKETNVRFTKSLKFMLIPRARDIASMIKRLQSISRDAIESRKSNDEIGSKFTLEISDTDDDIEMELSRICNSKSMNQQEHACEVLGRYMQRTIEDIETLSGDIYKLIDSQKEEAGGVDNRHDSTNHTGNCCSALFRLLLSGGGDSERRRNDDRSTYEIVENNGT